MKNLWIVISVMATMLASCTGPRFNDDPREHAEWVEASRTSGEPVISLDTIFSKGIPFARIEKNPSWVGGYFANGLRILSISGDGQIEVRQVMIDSVEYNQYECLGTAFREKACMSSTGLILISAIDPIVTADLFTPVGLNREKAEAFCLSHRCGTSKPLSFLPGQMVDRDRSKPLAMAEGTIRQAGVIIATYDSTVVTNPKNSYSKDLTYRIYYVDRSPCATVSYGTSRDEAFIKIRTAKDGKDHSIQKYYGTADYARYLGYLISNAYL